MILHVSFIAKNTQKSKKKRVPAMGWGNRWKRIERLGFLTKKSAIEAWENKRYFSTFQSRLIYGYREYVLSSSLSVLMRIWTEKTLVMPNRPECHPKYLKFIIENLNRIWIVGSDKFHRVKDPYKFWKTFVLFFSHLTSLLQASERF